MKRCLSLRAIALSVLMYAVMASAAWADASVVVLPYDVTHPREIKAEVRGSGQVASGEINIRKLGDQIYSALATRMDGVTLVGELTLDGLEPGTYEILAVATDNAGITRASSSGPDGQPARFEVYRRAPTSVSLRKGKLLRGGLVRGSVRVDGRAGADVVVLVERRPVNGTQWQQIGQARSGRSGAFGYRMPRLTGPSSEIRFSVPGGLRRRASSASRMLVQASRTSLRVDRSRARIGQAVTFSGQISTLPVPASGKVVWLQAYDRGRWVTFARPRSSQNGAWSYSYKFRRSRGVVTYPFRAVLSTQTGFPYGGGVSDTVRVRVRGY